MSGPLDEENLVPIPDFVGGRSMHTWTIIFTVVASVDPVALITLMRVCRTFCTILRDVGLVRMLAKVVCPNSILLTPLSDLHYTNVYKAEKSGTGHTCIMTCFTQQERRDADVFEVRGTLQNNASRLLIAGIVRTCPVCGVHRRLGPTDRPVEAPYIFGGRAAFKWPGVCDGGRYSARGDPPFEQLPRHVCMDCAPLAYNAGYGAVLGLSPDTRRPPRYPTARTQEIVHQILRETPRSELRTNAVGANNRICLYAHYIDQAHKNMAAAAAAKASKVGSYKEYQQEARRCFLSANGSFDDASVKCLRSSSNLLFATTRNSPH